MENTLKEYIIKYIKENNIFEPYKFFVEGQFYFTDDNIWYQGKKQEPRKIEFNVCDVNVSKNEGTFIDKDGDEYTIDLNLIIVEEVYAVSNV